MNWKEISLSVISVSSSVFIVILIACIGKKNTQFSLFISLSLIFIFFLSGWYLVWKLFLSRFKLVRELLGQINDNSSENQSNRTKSASSSSKGKKLRKD
jgi:hypothetical protein